MNSVAARYAQALFECAVEQGKLESVRQDAAKLQSLLFVSQDFLIFLANPLIQKSAALEIFRAFSEKLKFSDLVLKFIELLIRQKRLKNLSKILSRFNELLDAKSNTMEIHVSSAKPLTIAQRRSLKKTLKLKLNKEIALHEKIDADLIGGTVVRIGGYLVDATVRTRLDKLQKAMGM